MNQVLHIFRKDVRRHWIEILMSLLLLIGFAWKLPIIWNDESPFGESQPSRWLFGLLVVCLCLSWWFLIVRVIQGESLVGDRQFWLTRPYERRWLIVAKATFVIAFVNLPVLIFDVVFLVRFGFSPWRHVPELLQGQFELTALLILPIATISVITESPTQFLVTLLGVVAYITGLTWVVGWIPSSSAGGDIPGGATLILAASACLAVLVLQYFRRETVLSRWIVLGSACVIVIVVTAAPYDFLVEHTYPPLAISSLSPADVRIERINSANVDDSPVLGRTLSLNVPVDSNGVLQGSFVVINATRLSLYAPGGFAWNSGWVSTGQTLWPTPSSFVQTFDVSSKFYSSVKDKIVDMRIGLAVTEYREGTPKQVTVTADSFKVTDSGICSIGQARYFDSPVVKCKAAFSEPVFAAHLDPARTTCTLPDSTWPSLQITRNAGNPDVDLGGGLGLFPVQPFEIDFGGATDPSGKKTVSVVCPGTSFGIATLDRLRQYRIETGIEATHLANYRSASVSFSFR
jgi:hypothetical protein